MEINIRHYRKEDIPKIFALIEAHALEDYNKLITVNSVEKMMKEKDFFRCCVAEVENEIVGIALYSFTYRSWSGRDIYFDDLFVKKDFRRNGIGENLINFMLEDASAQGVSRVNWQTSESNFKARALYKKVGAEIEEGKCDCNYYF